MTGTLQGKVALITGSGRGIGRSIALKLAREGAAVVVNDLDEQPAREVIDAIRSAGGGAVACLGSVTAPEFPQRFIDTAIREFGGIDIIVNNAGYVWDSVIQKTTDEQWQTMLDVHLSAPFRILRAAHPVLRSQHAADVAAGRRVVRKVVNISSVAGVFGNVGQAGYSAGKAGIHGLTQTLAKEWGRLAVTVNCVAFGFIKTRLMLSTAEQVTEKIDGRDIRIGVNAHLYESLTDSIPMGRPGTTDEAAGSVYLFCIPESDYVSGQVLMCSGGLTGI